VTIHYLFRQSAVKRFPVSGWIFQDGPPWDEGKEHALSTHLFLLFQQVQRRQSTRIRPSAMLRGMSFPVSLRIQQLVGHWWHSVQDSVADLLSRYAPMARNEEAPAAPRLSRVEAGVVRFAIGLIEALVRRMLVIMCAEYGPMPAPPHGAKLLFRMDECPPQPVIRTPRSEDPDFFLKAPAAGSLPADRPADGLVSAAPLLKRLAALMHVFENGELYLQAMSARLRAPQKPLPAPQPDAFLDPALRPEQADNMQHLHDVALSAQAHDSS
jgi:hypothetical protein